MHHAGVLRDRRPRDIPGRVPADDLNIQMLQGTMLETVKAATIVVTIGPIILVYPFLQRFFVKGLLIGALKG